MNLTQHLGAFAFGFLVVGLSLVPIVWPYDLKHTFSQHVARHKAARLYFIMLFSCFIPLFLLFFVYWFTPHMMLPTFITLSVILSALFQYSSAFVAETEGRKRTLHRALTAISAFMLIPTVVYLSLSTYGLLQIISITCLIGMLIMPIAFLHPKFMKFGESYLIQVSFYLAFFIPVLTATYLI